MKKMISFFTVGLVALLSIDLKAQVSIPTGTTVQSVLPTPSATAFDRLRVQGGLLTHFVSGSVGSFGTSDKWIGIGQPLSSLYGNRIQWNGQALNMALREQTAGGIKNALIEWGNDGGEMQFRYITDPNVSTGFKKIISLTSTGNAYVGDNATPLTTPIGGIDLFGTTSPKFDINTPLGQTALRCNTENSFGFILTNNCTSADNTQRPAMIVRSIFTSGTPNKSVFGIDLQATGGTSNTGISAFTAGNQNSTSGSNVAISGNTAYGATAFGVRGSASIATINYGIYGDANSAPNPVNNFAGYFNGKVFATSYTTPSDERLKSKINKEDASFVMSKIRQLNPVTYSYNSKSIIDIQLPETLQHGFIAQELQKVFPEMISEVSHPVFEKDKSVRIEKFLGVNYNMLISVLTKAIQEEDAYIQALESRITELENRKNTTVASLEKVKPTPIQQTEGFELSQNVPNPFSGVTTIKFSVPSSVTNAAIAIFDLNGKMLLNFNNLKGKSQISVEGNKLPAGMYFYSLINNGEEIISKKMIVSK